MPAWFAVLLVRFFGPVLAQILTVEARIMSGIAELKAKLDKLEADVAAAVSTVSSEIQALKLLIAGIQGGATEAEIAEVAARVDAIDAAVQPLTVPTDIPGSNE